MYSVTYTDVVQIFFIFFGLVSLQSSIFDCKPCAGAGSPLSAAHLLL